jgi:2-polyprenyl-3-methyl-5-hydroxy-6-metoxy-1,4-benzoquinol methylase
LHTQKELSQIPAHVYFKSRNHLFLRGSLGADFWTENPRVGSSILSLGTTDCKEFARGISALAPCARKLARRHGTSLGGWVIAVGTPAQKSRAHHGTMDLKETDILGDDISSHWYYRSKASAMTRFLGTSQRSRLLDVGAGSGFFSRHLLDHTEAHEAWCVDVSYGRESDAIHNGKPIHFRQSVDQVNADLVLLMDVLEHVDDDVGLLASYVGRVPSGARFLISVPAFQSLWSEHDLFLEHKRRYRLTQIESVAQRAGLTVCRGAYYFGAIFPIAAATRIKLRTRTSNEPPRSQLSRHSTFVNSTLSTLCRLELPFMRFNRLAGLTAFCLAEKRCPSSLPE